MLYNIKEHTFFDNFLRKEINVIDLGTCQGEFIDEIDNLFNVKKSILIEANPTNFKKIKTGPNRVLYNKAIDSVNGSFIEFYEDPGSPYNGSKHFNYFNGIKHQIETVTLEALCDENDIDFIDILKIDIEGAEYEVLEKLPDDFFNRIGQITVEFHDFVDPSLKPKTQAIIDRMHSLGFNHISKPIQYMYNSENYDVLFYRAPKVGVLYLCTGKYVNFLEGFLSSASQKFLPNSNKKYFIFTDAEFDGEWDSDIKIIKQEQLGFDKENLVSKDSLMRYHIFNKHKDLFEGLDYLVFFNSNMVFNDYIFEEEFLPSDNDSGLVSVHHSGHYLNGNSWNGYESNSKSISYINPVHRTKKYCQGCLIGGKVFEFLMLSKEVSKMIDIDLDNGQYTSAWDEPYMNKYLLNTNVKVLHPGYAYPEIFRDRMGSIQNKITQLDKGKYISYEQLRS